MDPIGGTKSRAAEGRRLLFLCEGSHGLAKGTQLLRHLLLLRGCHWCRFGPNKRLQSRLRDAVLQTVEAPLRQEHRAQRHRMSQEPGKVPQRDECHWHRRGRSAGSLIQVHGRRGRRKGRGRGALVEVLNHMTRLHQVLYLGKGNRGGPVFVEPLVSVGRSGDRREATGNCQPADRLPLPLLELGLSGMGILIGQLEST